MNNMIRQLKITLNRSFRIAAVLDVFYVFLGPSVTIHSYRQSSKQKQTRSRTRKKTKLGIVNIHVTNFKLNWRGEQNPTYLISPTRRSIREIQAMRSILFELFLLRGLARPMNPRGVDICLSLEHFARPATHRSGKLGCNWVAERKSRSPLQACVTMFGFKSIESEFGIKTRWCQSSRFEIEFN